MKYVRNSGRNKKPIKKKREKPLTNREQLELLQKREVEKALVADVEWLNELNDLNQYSIEWVHKVAVELLLQSMGKKEVIMGFKGNEQLVRVFKEKAAQEALNMIAKMNGHLFDTVKGTIKAHGTIEHDHKHEIELKPNVNRTAEVFEILEACGALKPGPKQLSAPEMVSLYPA